MMLAALAASLLVINVMVAYLWILFLTSPNGERRGD